MKVKDLLKEIKDCIKQYPGFLEWDVYTEQLTHSDKVYKRKPHAPDGHYGKKFTAEDLLNDPKYGQGWDFCDDAEGWEYFKCEGYWTKMPKEKIFTINVNF